MGGEAGERPGGRRRRREAQHGRRMSRRCWISRRAARAVLDYGNNIRQMAKEEGLANAFDFPGFVPAYIRPLFCRGIGPFRWAALSGDPEDIRRTDAKVRELIPDDPHLHRWLDMARERIAFQGLPARICWVGLGQRDRLGLAFNEMVARGEIGPDRHRPRPPGFRQRRQPEPGDGGDARRVRRGLRLAAAERAAEHGVAAPPGCQPAPWRRRRHGVQPACRHGHRLRRHARPRRGASRGCCGTTRRPA